MLQALQTVLERRGSEGWSVGGTVRDRLLGRSSLDHDVVVADDPAEVARQLAALLRAPWFPLSTRHGAYRVLGREAQVDVAALRGEGILDDLALRDFTINAMALPLGEGFEGIIDPFGGRRHLDERRLVAVSKKVFQDDPLRLMRAVRLSSTLGLTIEPALEELLRAEAALVTGAAPERIMAELALMLQPGQAPGAVDALGRTGLLRAVVPEAVMSAEAVVEIEALDREMAGRVWRGSMCEGDMEARMEVRMGAPVDGVFSRPAALCLATLLRGVGSAKIGGVARRLKLSGEISSLLKTAATWFERASQAGPGAGAALVGAVGSGRAATLFLWQTEPWEPEVVLMAEAAGAVERRAVDGAPAADVDAAASALLRRWVERSVSMVTPPFDGRLLMEALGLEEGPALGAVLRETRLAWEAGEIQDLEGALAVAEAARAGHLRQ